MAGSEAGTTLISLRALQAYAQEEAYHAEGTAAACRTDPAYHRAAESAAHRARMMQAMVALCTALIGGDKATTRTMIDKGIVG